MVLSDSDSATNRSTEQSLSAPMATVLLQLNHFSKQWQRDVNRFESQRNAVEGCMEDVSTNWHLGVQQTKRQLFSAEERLRTMSAERHGGWRTDERCWTFCFYSRSTLSSVASRGLPLVKTVKCLRNPVYGISQCSILAPILRNQMSRSARAFSKQMTAVLNISWWSRGAYGRFFYAVYSAELRLFSLVSLFIQFLYDAEKLTPWMACILYCFNFELHSLRSIPRRPYLIYRQVSRASRGNFRTVFHQRTRRVWNRCTAAVRPIDLWSNLRRRCIGAKQIHCHVTFAPWQPKSLVAIRLVIFPIMLWMGRTCVKTGATEKMMSNFKRLYIDTACLWWAFSALRTCN